MAKKSVEAVSKKWREELLRIPLQSPEGVKEEDLLGVAITSRAAADTLGALSQALK